MNKREFSEEVKAVAVERLRETDSNISAVIREVEKNNGISHTGISFMGTANIQPIIYMDHMYEMYAAGQMKLDEVVDAVCLEYQNNMVQEDFNINTILDYEKVKDKLSVVVRNAERNERMLGNIPHELHEDLAEMYRIDIDNFNGANGTILIKNDLMERWGIDQKTLKDDAWASMKSNHPCEMKSMFEVMKEITQSQFGEDMGPEVMEMMGVGRPTMYVFTTPDRMNGAAYILDQEFLAQVSEKLGEGFAILPSSIHECIVLPESQIDGYSHLKEMVEEVNATQLEADEILSDNVYRFDHNTQELTMFDGHFESMSMNM